MRGERPPGGIVSPSRYGAIMQVKGHLRLHRHSRLYRAKQDERSGMWSVNVYRSLTLYSNEDDSLVAEHRLHNIGIDVMQGLWNRPLDDPMPAVYPVEEWMMPTLAVIWMRTLRWTRGDFRISWKPPLISQARRLMWHRNGGPPFLGAHSKALENLSELPR
jgi:hypothetical protein